MSEKYVITTGIEYIGDDLCWVNDIKKAKLYTFNDAIEFIQSNDESDNLECLSISKNDFIITKKIKFIISKNKLSSNPSKAKKFNNRIDAVMYANKYCKFLLRKDVISDDQLKERINNICNEAPKEERVRFSKATRRIVFERCNKRCAICGRLIPKDQYSIDHILPLDRGGTNTIDNLQAACLSCNKLKSNSTDDEFVRGITTILSHKIQEKLDRDIVDAILKSCVKGYMSNMFGSDIANNVMSFYEYENGGN